MKAILVLNLDTRLNQTNKQLLHLIIIFHLFISENGVGNYSEYSA